MFVDFAAGTGFSKEAHPWSLDAGKSGGPEVVGFWPKFPANKSVGVDVYVCGGWWKFTGGDGAPVEGWNVLTDWPVGAPGNWNKSIGAFVDSVTEGTGVDFLSCCWLPIFWAISDTPSPKPLEVYDLIDVELLSTDLTLPRDVVLWMRKIKKKDWEVGTSGKNHFSIREIVTLSQIQRSLLKKVCWTLPDVACFHLEGHLKAGDYESHLLAGNLGTVFQTWKYLLHLTQRNLKLSEQTAHLRIGLQACDH